VRIVKAQQLGKPVVVPADTMKRRGFELLERSAVKVACSVLRKVGLDDGVRLSDFGKKAEGTVAVGG
jgi:hypothetical protein